MANTSASGGYLNPSASPAPLQGDALFDFFQAWIVGITGMQGVNVRPRWQPEPPNIPLDGIDWAAFGITNRKPQAFAAEIHYPAAGQNAGYDEIRNHEELTILVSFYGANADNNASLLREGMSLAQNREVLSLNNMGIVGFGDALAVPEMIKEKWLYRVDFEFVVRRQIVRDYPVLDLVSAQGTINNEHYTETVTAI